MTPLCLSSFNLVNVVGYNLQWEEWQSQPQQASDHLVSFLVSEASISNRTHLATFPWVCLHCPEGDTEGTFSHLNCRHYRATLRIWTQLVMGSHKVKFPEGTTFTRPSSYSYSLWKSHFLMPLWDDSSLCGGSYSQVENVLQRLSSCEVCLSPVLLCSVWTQKCLFQCQPSSVLRAQGRSPWIVPIFSASVHFL